MAQLLRSLAGQRAALDARAILRGDRIYSLSLDGLSLEVRSSHDFEMIQRLPIPANMVGQWHIAKCGQALVTIQNPQTSAPETYRLQDLSPVSELNNWAPVYFDHRYHLFKTTDGARRRLLVYDGPTIGSR